MPANQDFFANKKQWSRIKDKVLGGYLVPYIAKLSRLGRKILIVDGFAGRGVFEDKTPGSPMLICSAAERNARVNYEAIFVNKESDDHEFLTNVLAAANYKNARTVRGDSADYLSHISETLTNESLFLYLDPFGVTTTFDQLLPFLNRSQEYSTEIVINLSMPITHRLAAYKAVANGKGDASKIQSFHARLDAVFGGSYWRPIYHSDLSPREKELQVMTEYQSRLRQCLPYVGACPVRGSRCGGTKYYITFASRHPDSMMLMNDIMCKAFSESMHEAEYKGTLLANTDWRSTRNPAPLRSMIISLVVKNPGSTRLNVWQSIVQSNFMRFLSGEYKNQVKELAKAGGIRVEYTKTGRLNDNCRLFPQ